MKNQYFFETGKILILFLIFSAFAFAQSTVNKNPAPKPKPIPKTAPLPKTDEAPVTPPAAPNEKRVENDRDIPYEKSIEVEKEVAINLEVCEGKVRINGWDRNEVRVFVNGGSKVGFKYAPPRKKGGKTASIIVLGYDPKVDKGSNLSNCLYGDEIELDVPKGARISKLEGRDTNIWISSVIKANVVNNEGNIFLSDIEEGVSATTFGGAISVENSAGVINLNSTDGNIFVYNTEPIDVGDALTVKSNSGSVVLQSINHSMVFARSISNIVRFQGEIKADGQYTFENTSGEIFLEIPEDSSCQLEAIAAKNKFLAPEFKFVTYNIGKVDSTLQKISAVMGDGEALVKLQNGSGRIRLIKMK